MRRVLCAIAVLALLVGGCTKKEEPVAAPTPSASPSPSPSPEPPPIAALTGVQLDEAIDRPVLAVKIDNASAALPPDGIEDADIVFEEEVEGGLTRFLALFHSMDPKEIGPVRSGREADVELLPPFNPLLALSGAAGSVENMFRRADIRFVQEGEADGAFYRVQDRVAPHNLFAHTDKLWAAGEDLPVPEEPVFEFSEEVPDKGKKAAQAFLEFSPFANAQWTYDDSNQRWLRDQNGSLHATADGRKISADNVVVMMVKASQGNRRDSSGNPTVELEVVGKGKAFVLRDGQWFRARWSKDSPEDPLEFTTPRGDTLPLRPGQTWIEILPVGDTLEVRKAEQ